MSFILCYCRPGLESDCAAEVMDRAAEAGFYGYIKSADSGAGYIRFFLNEPEQAMAFVDEMPFHEWIFPRQCLLVTREIDNLPVQDRISAIVAEVSEWPEVEAVWQEYPDTNEGKQITRLTKKLEKPLLNALRKQGTLNLASAGGVRGHLFWLSGSHLLLGLSAVDNAAPWLLGYPRLRVPRQAPSRSTLKLEEAWLQLMSAAEVEASLKPGFRAVDLGAAPGGWTWQLVNREMKVFAVDNGPMDDGLMASGRVTHLREDAFTFKPRYPMEWLVCDIVDKPARVMQLMERWLLNGWCQHAIFNLKLPMKQRWKTVKGLLTQLESALAEADPDYVVRAKQLYHDREEITVYAACVAQA
ncbi:MAG: 23S rRNA (cytidine(2498)-2'-O)-methyltransferase RlmM [Ketobacteraceae bacterium]|nr:23S rRNA (cytidine(2498)-2'-O)-methyltransferase RlmM [Ketobacteraceae bacterium]